MPSTRLLAAVAALTCAAGTAAAAITASPATASPQAASPQTASPAAGSRETGTALPAHVFAPYYLNLTDTLAATSRASGAKYITLAFLQTAKSGSCTVYWNGDTKQPVGTYAKGIAAVQAEGGNVVPSFGGASADSAQQELADSCTSVPAIAAQYEKVIEAYHVTRLDLDTEEDSLSNYAGIDRRNKAIAMVEQWGAREHRTVQFVYTIPTNTTGPDQGGSYVLQDAVVNHAQIAIVNVMTFDYYDNLPHEMGDETEGAATQIYDRLHELYPGRTSAQLWGMIGVTEDLGVDDFGSAETFTLADAHAIEQWAAAKGLAEVSFWNLQDDNTAGSHVKQSPYEYSHILEPFTSSAAVTSARLAPLTASTQHGSLRSVSCPTAAFCMAVDQSGNNALRWNGTSWSAPASIDPGGDKAELSSVSCASPAFCVAVDTLGRAMRWDGQSWTSPRPITNTGLTSVSCPSSTFCVAVSGGGDALTYNGTSWSAAHVDGTGSSLQSVSCASSSFCAAGDWDGSVYTFNGAAWSTPRAIDAAGGGISSLSCPVSGFCVGTDWNGGEVSWNGAKWTLKANVDANAAGGLMEVSCQSATWCMAVDGSGDYLTWNGTTWTSPVMIDLTGDGFESVSCGATTSCVAVDWNGNALVYNGTSWTAPAISCPRSTASSAGNCYTKGSYADPRTGVPDSVSCPTTTWCMTVDENGTAHAGSGPAADIDPIAGILTSVSCPSTTFCMVVDTNGYALEWNGTDWSVPVWSAGSPVDKRGPLEGVSCPSSAFCLAVDGNGNVLRWNGRSWSAPQATGASELTGVSCVSSTDCAVTDAQGTVLMQAPGGPWWPVFSGGVGGLAGVSCASAGPAAMACVAVGDEGTAEFTEAGSPDNGGGTVLATRLRDGLTAVSCTSARHCVAVGSKGDYTTWNGRSWSAPVTEDPSGGGFTSVSCASRASCTATDFAGRQVRLS